MPRSPSNNHPLRNVRRIADLTQAQLAKRIGVTTETIQKIENGKLSMSYEIATRLCFQLGCDMTREISSEGKDVWSVSDQVTATDGSDVPYTFMNYLEQESKHREYGKKEVDACHEGLASALLLVLRGAARAGKLLSLTYVIERALIEGINDFGLSAHLAGWLQEEGLSPNRAQHLVEFLQWSPVKAGFNYRKRVGLQISSECRTDFYFQLRLAPSAVCPHGRPRPVRTSRR